MAKKKKSSENLTEMAQSLLQNARPDELMKMHKWIEERIDSTREQARANTNSAVGTANVRKDHAQNCGLPFHSINERQGNYLYESLRDRMEDSPDAIDEESDNFSFDAVQKALEKNPDALFTLYISERTGGMPFVRSLKKGYLTFWDTPGAPGTGNKDGILADEEHFTERIQTLLQHGRKKCVYDRFAENHHERFGKSCSTVKSKGVFNGNAVQDAAEMGFDRLLSAEECEKLSRYAIDDNNLHTWFWLHTDSADHSDPAPWGNFEVLIGGEFLYKFYLHRQSRYHYAESGSWAGCLRTRA